MIAELANGFAEKGYPVAILTLSATATDHYPLRHEVERIALDVIWESSSIWQSVWSNIRRSRDIRRGVLRFGPDVVVSFIEQTNVRILAALAGTKLPIIVSERIDPRQHFVGRSWDWARRLLYPLAGAVVVQTESIAQWARGLVSADRVHVLPNFVRDLPPLSFEVKRSERAILAAGRLDAQKGFDLLLRAFAASGLVAEDVRLTILGEGPERNELAALARRLGVDRSVSFPGVVRDPERWMAQSAVFVLPSRYEGFPNVLLEAMAMGCAVVAADCNSGPRQIIQDRVDGLLVPVEDVEAISEALRRLMEDSYLRQRLSSAALAVRQRFDKRAILEQWNALLHEVIGR